MTWDLSLHVLTDDSVTDAGLVTIVNAAVSAGATVIQLRAKHQPARLQVALAGELARVIDGRAAFIINDRIDVALAARHAGARIDGVHLGQDDVSPVVARALLGPDALIGWTADTPAHFAAAAALPARTLDYLGTGAIHPTATKPDAPEALGIAGFAAIAPTASLPCVAIGGITVNDVSPLLAAGAAGVAVVSAVLGAADPAAATGAFRAALSLGSILPLNTAAHALASTQRATTPALLGGHA